MAQSSQTEIIELKSGDSTVINLKGLASAGYEWTCDSGNNEIISIRKDFVMEKPNSPVPTSASAAEVFTIKALKKGTIVLHFSQSRSWEKNVPPVNTKTMEIRISD